MINKHQKVIIYAVGIICLLVGYLIWAFVDGKRGIPFVGIQTEWSIGIYIGDSPINFSSSDKVKNPCLTAKDVTDVPALFVADPFMLNDNNMWYMFFEVLNEHTEHGDIGLAASDDGMAWRYQQIVLDEPFHLSYPYVFKWKSEYYMIPETLEPKGIRLYKALHFPDQWKFFATLLEGKYADPSIYRYDDKWWMFACPRPYKHDILVLYYSNELKGPWIEHPMSPIIENNANIARPGGRVLIIEDKIIRYTQDDEPTYGSAVLAYEIIELTTKHYREKSVDGNPILKRSGNRWGWNSIGMHHIDPHQINEKKWIACVDGYGESLVFGTKY